MNQSRKVSQTAKAKAFSFWHHNSKLSYKNLDHDISTKYNVYFKALISQVQNLSAFFTETKNYLKSILALPQDYVDIIIYNQDVAFTFNESEQIAVDKS